MELNKRAVFFTIASIVMIAVLISSYTIISGYRQKEKMFVEKIRIETVDSFIEDVEKDLGRGLYISSFRSLLVMQDFIATNNSYLDNASYRFDEAMRNETIFGKTHDLLINESFATWTRKIQSHAERIDIICNFSIYNITINQTDPWTITVATDVGMNVSDKRNTAFWNRAQHIEVELPIEGFEDPIYTLNTMGRIVNPIIKSNYTYFDDLSELRYHISNSLYLASNDSPSFLMRLEGNYSASEYGIESVVNLGEFPSQGLSVEMRSSVDYLYFSNSTLSVCIINQTINDSDLSWFRLDNATGHLALYKVICKP